jgi:hypothetical protein
VRTPVTKATAASLLLAVAGVVAIFVAVGDRSWPLIVGWSLAVAAFAWLWRSQAHRPPAQLAIAAAAVAVLVVLTWEGGLFLVPAALVAAAAAAWRLRERRHARLSPGH